MKSVYLSLFFSLLVVFANSQIVVRKVHAYKQANIPGAMPIEGMEQKISNNYWIYIETKKTEKITVSDLWINGKRFAAKNQTIARTPVRKIINTGNITPDTVLLVPRTIYKVILATPTNRLKDSVITTKPLVDMIKRSDVVIGYLWKGKKYFTSLREFAVLQSEAHQ